MLTFELSRMTFILLVCLLSNSHWVLYPCWDSFKRRCGKHTDHFMTCWFRHLQVVGKRRLHLKGSELNLSSATWINAGIYREERYDCTCVEVASKKAVRVPDTWTHLKDLGKGTSTFWPIFTLWKYYLAKFSTVPSVEHQWICTEANLEVCRALYFCFFDSFTGFPNLDIS